MGGRYRRGDTLIELVLAFAIFSIAAISALAVMNRGIALSQHSLETTLVRQQMDSQAETIRYLRDTSSPLWDTIKNHADNNTKIAPLSPSTCPQASDIAAVANGHNGFFVGRDTGTGEFTIVDVDNANYSQPSRYAQIDRDARRAYGLWVQAARAEDGNQAVKAYDIYIHACWESVAMTNVPATLGTIVRIYDK